MDETAMPEIGGDIMKKVARIQELGQAIVGLRASIIELDQRRAKLRESTHAIRRNEQSLNEKNSYTALCPTLFVQYPNEHIKKALSNDIQTLDQMISDNRNEVKLKVDELMRLEGNANLAALGFDLNSIIGPNLAKELLLH